MYENHAFGDASLRWDQPAVHGVGRLEGPEEAREWLREVQAQVRGSVATLDDAELDRPRRTNWGEMAPTLWIVTVIIEHDHYHAGEINHIRSLRQGDRWAYDPPESSGRDDSLPKPASSGPCLTLGLTVPATASRSMPLDSTTEAPTGPID